jgi:hypothetical protein
MCIMAEEDQPAVPATEKRGGEKPDWLRARPGQELPEREDPPDPQPEPGEG